MCSSECDPKKPESRVRTSNMQRASAPTPSGCLELLEDFDVLNPGLYF